jgi:hypothetical protein
LPRIQDSGHMSTIAVSFNTSLSLPTFYGSNSSDLVNPAHSPDDPIELK